MIQTLLYLVSAAIVLMTIMIILLVAALIALARVLNHEARKRGLLDAVDLMHRRKRWYA